MKQLLFLFTFLISVSLFAQDTITVIPVIKDSKLSFSRKINNKNQPVDSVALFKTGGYIRIVSENDLNGFLITIKNNNGDDQKKVLEYTVGNSLHELILSVSQDQLLSGVAGVTPVRLARAFSIFLSKPGIPASRVNAYITMDKDADKNIVTGSQPVFSVSGIALTDANILQRNLSMDSVLSILSYYRDQDRNTIFRSYDEAKAYFGNAATKNSFILGYLNSLPNLTLAQGSKGYSFISQGLAAAGGLDVTSIADGFAKFIVKRTKEELSVTFFERFTKTIDTVPDLKALFPQTHRTLMTIGTEVYMYQAYIQTLRESFEKDLSSLPGNLPKIVENHKAYFDNNPDIRAELLSGFYIAEQIQAKQHPGDMIGNYPVDEIFTGDVNMNAKASFQALQLLSASLRSGTESDSYWAPAAGLKKLYTDVGLLKIYLGLLEQKTKIDTIKFQDVPGNSVLLSGLIERSYSTFANGEQYKSFLKNFSLKAGSLDAKIKGLKKSENDSILFESYYVIVTNSIGLLNYAAEIETLPLFPQGLALREKVAGYTAIAQRTADIAVDVNRRNYSSAIVNTVSLFDNTIKEYSYRRTRKIQKLRAESETLGSDFTKVNKELKYANVMRRISDSLKTNDIPQLVAKTKQQLKDKKGNTVLSDVEITGIAYKLINNTDYLALLAKGKTDAENSYKAGIAALEAFKAGKISDTLSNGTFDQVLKYGTFMATLVQAESSEEVESAIEAFALPSGSARIKRQTPFNVSLNAYSGVFLGWEQIKGVDRPACFKKGYEAFNSYGITAPIGIAISTSTCGWSFTAFMSVVDLGAVTAFRFSNDSTESVPTIELKDIISPGIFFSLGLPKCPLSLNVGYQAGPLLREVNQMENTYEKKYTRLSFSLNVDIPILNFYTKSKK
ncbi:MAG: hypothetical protein JWO09_2568 [Bacteroidetes bacterium]|nr:hypothetical protein [Bacteroidota bacterium]